MTRTVGYIIKGAPCCGARYKTPRYSSMNWMSAAFWSDGYREQSLMPNDHGLRRCLTYLKRSELRAIGFETRPSCCVNCATDSTTCPQVRICRIDNAVAVGLPDDVALDDGDVGFGHMEFLFEPISKIKHSDLWPGSKSDREK